MNTLTIDHDTFLVPAEANELSRPQLLAILGLFSEKLELGQLRVRLCQIIIPFFGSNKQLRKVWKKLMKVDNDLYQWETEDQLFWMEAEEGLQAAYVFETYLFPLVDWLLNEEKNGVQLKGLTNNPLRLRNGLIGPNANFEGMTFDQFASAESYYIRYQHTNEPEMLDKLIGSLYRLDYAGFDLARFRLLRTKRDLLAEWSNLEKQAFLLFYESVKASWTRKYKYLFKFKARKEGEKRERPNPFIWAEIMDDLAEKVHLTEAIGKQNLFQVFFHLDRKLEKIRLAEMRNGR